MHAMQCYLQKKYIKNSENKIEKLAYKYYMDYVNKYKYQLLFILIGIHNSKKKYYSFNTFAYLSSGAVNDFISLCRNTFYHLDIDFFLNYKQKSVIPTAIQSEGSLDTAAAEMNKTKLNDENGTEMHTFAMNMGNVFKKYHGDIYAKYPETTQFAFNDEVQIDTNKYLQSVRDNLLKWGVIIKKDRPQRITIGLRRGSIYFLNRIFSPLFDISYRTRGGYNVVLNTSLFEHSIKASMEPNDIINWDKRIKALHVKETKTLHIEDNVETISKILDEDEYCQQLSLFKSGEDSE